MRKLIIITLCFTISYLHAVATGINIIPKPQSITIGDGEFQINKRVILLANNEASMLTATYFRDLLENSTPLKIKSKISAPKDGAICFNLDESFKSDNQEAYTLEVTPSRVTITASTEAGLFYGAQSLRQLLPASIESEKSLKENKTMSIPAVKITDEPRFGWRGYMKDVSRTFYSVDVVKKYIDVMSLYKMNVLHLHLTDDQGWRVEIKRYPKLTTPQTTEFPAQYNQPKERSGFYTQEDIKDLVKYAQDRHITIVPEIDVPGHSWATLLAYPELGVNDNHTPNHVFPFLDSWGHWGNQFTPNSLDPTNEEVYTFLSNVFTEIAELFPSEYIHFGGDEVMHRFWDEQPHIQKFMKDNNMKGSSDLQSYFVDKVAKIIVSKGRKPIGWNDILAGPALTKETAIMSWLGADAITKAVKNGHKAVATPTYPLYFDICQDNRDDGTMCDLNYGVIIPLKAVYEYDPAEGLSEEESKYLLGVQANMWPAVPQEVKDINVQNFPRLLAVAEIGWSSEKDKNFENFDKRVEESKKRLDLLKVDYFRDGGYITNRWSPEDITTTYQTIEWDVTHKVYASGRVSSGFFYTSGANFLEIDGVELLQDGEVISSDSHYGLADKFRGIHKTKTYVYNMEVERYDPEATYTLRAKVKGQNGADSNGNLTFNLSPYIPFSAIEKR